MQLSDRIRRVKIVLVVAAVIIAGGSLLVSNTLTRDLKKEEQRKMEVWAEAMRSLNNADENTDMNLVLKIIDTNDLIPIIVVASDGSVEDSRNISINAATAADSTAYLLDLADFMQSKGNSIRIVINDAAPKTDFIDVRYDDSLMLRRLRLYPFIQLGIVLIFVVIAIFALLTSKKAEQNKVWVGLSKETAHQLGTPISSLMAWTEILKENYPADELIPEMDKDVQRLQLIADRFSKIGSKPELVETDICAALRRVGWYMERRIPKTVRLHCNLPAQPVMVRGNASLFEWVVENLCKNAVDAIEGDGEIRVRLIDEGRVAAIEVSDTGKGIAKKDINSVFQPGFTTKQRGWGLGLSLAKRIVEEYHKGKIWVKKSELGKGTTFRIELKK
ncbi:MAG: HAMP domain-containing histidine kinase [Prevotella sp.]|nr:HAMP domain-containing histidine kinase [Prevotella sp.]MCD8306328.1 HAMP domain-containing histidine kinase [Prevotella sp.]